MKMLLKLNFIALGIPIVLGIISFMYGLVSTMLTGAIQVLIAIIMLVMNCRNIHLYIYLATTLLFFLLWLVFAAGNWIFALPPALAIYLTYIVTTEYKKSLL